MDECVILIDNSNIWIEGMKFSARRKGITRKPGEDKDPVDYSWHVDFGKILTALAAGRKIHAALLVGSRPPQNDSLWKAAELSGFEVIVHDRNASGKEKAVDTQIAVHGTRLIYKARKPMALVIGSGDADFIPLVHEAQANKWEVEMCAFSSAFNDSGALATTVDKIRPLDEIFDQIGTY